MNSLTRIFKISAVAVAVIAMASCGGRDGRQKPSGHPVADTCSDASATGADTVSFLFAGDAMQHKPQLQHALAAGGGKTYAFDQCFTLIAPAVKAADYAVVNLEVPLGGGPDYSGYPMFSAPDSYAAALKDAGFDMLLTANNHSLDRGAKGARRTLTVLDSLGLDHTGTFSDSLDRSRRVPCIRDIKGAKVGFLNYTYGTNGLVPRDGIEISYIDRDKIAAEMQATRRAGANIIIVAMHWGIEYQLNENAEQRSLAQFLVDQGADMIVGSHPHVIQPYKVVHNAREGKDVLVIYSLGNFISNQDGINSRGGALVRARIARGADGKMRFHSADYSTFFTAKPTAAGQVHRVIPSWMPEHIPAAQRSTFEAFERKAASVFDTANVSVPRRPALKCEK